MKKKDELSNQNSCINKAHDDEMIFVLRGQDLTAPKTVLSWIAENIHYTHISDDKLREAFECALVMRNTPNRKLPD